MAVHLLQFKFVDRDKREKEASQDKKKSNSYENFKKQQHCTRKALLQSTEEEEYLLHVSSCILCLTFQCFKQQENEIKRIYSVYKHHRDFLLQRASPYDTRSL